MKVKKLFENTNSAVSNSDSAHWAHIGQEYGVNWSSSLKLGYLAEKQCPQVLKRFPLLQVAFFDGGLIQKG